MSRWPKAKSRSGFDARFILVTDGYAPKTRDRNKRIDGAIQKLIKDGQFRIWPPGGLLRDHRDKLDAMVAELLAHESLDEAEICAPAGIADNAVQPTDTAVPGRMTRAASGPR